jgi:hypothetical protein
MAFAAIHPDETRASVLHFLQVALAFYKLYGIDGKAVLTDNGVSLWVERFQAIRVAMRVRLS